MLVFLLMILIVFCFCKNWGIQFVKNWSCTLKKFGIIDLETDYFLNRFGQTNISLSDFVATLLGSILKYRCFSILIFNVIEYVLKFKRRQHRYNIQLLLNKAINPEPNCYAFFVTSLKHLQN